MKATTINTSGHVWHFIQTGGLVQLQITSIDDILNLDKLDPKLWIALTCPVKGLEFSEETLSLLDTDKNGRVRVPEILEAVSFIKKYFKRPDVIMSEGDSIPIDALSDELFACGHSPHDSAISVLNIVEKPDATSISLDDVSVQEKLFSPSVFNGDGVLPPDAAKDDLSVSVIKDIIACTGGADDISGVKGVTREQFASFFNDLRAIKEWRENAQSNASEIFFLKYETDAAASAYMKVRDKINDYYLRCSIDYYNNDVAAVLRKKEEEVFTEENELVPEQLALLPLARASADGTLSLGEAVNPAWRADMDAFSAGVVAALFGKEKSSLSESEWRKIEADFAPYMAWYAARPENSAGNLSLERMYEILASDAETLIAAYLDEEEKHPPIALATLDLRKMILFRRDFVRLLKNFVSFEHFYGSEECAIFQCGTLYIDGRSCELCFKVTDAAKHASMSPLSQCYLLYCTCTRPENAETMSIAAMVSAGSRDNLIVGRNGLFIDRQGRDWDATITKIVENPISIREAFWSPYKKLARMVQERAAKAAATAENKVTAQMSSAVEKPDQAIPNQTAESAKKMFDVGTIAALGVAISGFAAVISSILALIFKQWWMPPVFIIGLLLIISLPSMILAWMKLRQRNIAPILDASGWAVNGNVKINIPLGTLLTQTGSRPKGSKLNGFDPYAQKSFPVKRVILCVILLAAVVGAVVLVVKSGDIFSAVENAKNFFTKTIPSFFTKKIES
ncbi:MAG: hypothetical protein J1D88_05340 [Treponema sp.]|nr:hypothetical protein [Treponema sp.]